LQRRLRLRSVGRRSSARSWPAFWTRSSTRPWTSCSPREARLPRPQQPALSTSIQTWPVRPRLPAACRELPSPAVSCFLPPPVRSLADCLRIRLRDLRLPPFLRRRGWRPPAGSCTRGVSPIASSTLMRRS